MTSVMDKHHPLESKKFKIMIYDAYNITKVLKSNRLIGAVSFTLKFVPDSSLGCSTFVKNVFFTFILNTK